MIHTQLQTICKLLDIDIRIGFSTFNCRKRTSLEPQVPKQKICSPKIPRTWNFYIAGLFIIDNANLSTARKRGQSEIKHRRQDDAIGVLNLRRVARNITPDMSIFEFQSSSPWKMPHSEASLTEHKKCQLHLNRELHQSAMSRSLFIGYDKCILILLYIKLQLIVCDDTKLHMRPI